MKILGIDYGEKRVGIAISDENESFAFPLDVLENNGRIEELASALEKICREKNVSKIILGHSLNYQNEPNPVVVKTDKIKAILQEKGFEVIYHPEVLTSEEAKRIQGNISKLDASAAALILKNFIDKNKNVII